VKRSKLHRNICRDKRRGSSSEYSSDDSDSFTRISDDFFEQSELAARIIQSSATSASSKESTLMNAYEQNPDQPIVAAPFDFVSPQPAPTPPPSTSHSIFFGRFGMRAGWGMAIFIAGVLLLTVLGGIVAVIATGHAKEIMAARMQHQAHPNTPAPRLTLSFTAGLVTANDFTSFVGMAAMCFIFSKLERRRFGTYGIGKVRMMDFLPGAFWGLAALSVLVFAMHSMHVLYFDARLLSGPVMYAYGLKWLIAFLFVGFSEEYELRGYLQYTLTRGVYGLAEKISPERARFVAFWIAAGIMSLLFGALHLGNKGENALGILQVVLVGLVFSYVLWRTGSLWWAIGFHMAWDWAQSFLYGVPDSGNISAGRLFQTHAAGKPLFSGGVDGPEGSLLCVPVMLLVFVVVRFTTKQGVQPPLEQLPKEAYEPYLPVTPISAA
jgi:membrane protease YdiL (CAAX protease family)